MQATVYYLFGANARLVAAANWPVSPLPCYGREISVLCDQDVWIRFISVNPEYVKLVTQGRSAGEIARLGVLQTILEVEHFIPQNAMMTFRLTLGAGILFRANAASGTLNIWIGGNVEGTD